MGVDILAFIKPPEPCVEHFILDGCTFIFLQNVNVHAIVFKSLRFGPFTLKHNPGVFKLKRGMQRFLKSWFSKVL